MADVKEYAFYIEGDRVAIVERDTQFDNEVNSRDYGPGVHRTQWKSPKSGVTDGLEIQYTYVPRYTILNVDAKSSNLDTYYSEAGYLALDDTGNNDFTGTESLSQGSWFVLENAGRWNGLHQVQSSTGMSTGTILTNTQYPDGPSVSNKLKFHSDSSSPTLYYSVASLRYDTLHTLDRQEIPVPAYLEQAVIYYIRAKMAEDAGEFEMKEYFMREYKKITEKHDGALKPGAKILGTPGPYAIR